MHLHGHGRDPLCFSLHEDISARLRRVAPRCIHLEKRICRLIMLRYCGFSCFGVSAGSFEERERMKLINCQR